MNADQFTQPAGYASHGLKREPSTYQAREGDLAASWPHAMGLRPCEEHDSGCEPLHWSPWISGLVYMAGKEKGREKEKARLVAIAGHCRVSLSECNVPAGTEEQSEQSGLGIMDLKVQNKYF